MDIRMKLHRIHKALGALILIMGTLMFPKTVLAIGNVDYLPGRTIEFHPGSEYTDTDLFDGYRRMMPGDVRTQEITIRNEDTGHDYVKVYLRAIPLDETGNPPSPGVMRILTDDTRRGSVPELSWMYDFLSALHLTVKDASGNVVSEGTADKTAGLTVPAYVGQIPAGSSKTMTAVLEMPETLGNAYSGRIGEICWEFIFEVYDVSALKTRVVWDDPYDSYPSSVKVTLLRDGVPFEERILGSESSWYYVWDDLDDDYSWGITEAHVRDFSTAYVYRDGVWLIINTRKPSPRPDPGPDPDPDPDPPKPFDEPLPPGETAAQLPKTYDTGGATILAQTGSAVASVPWLMILGTALLFTIHRMRKEDETK